MDVQTIKGYVVGFLLVSSHLFVTTKAHRLSNLYCNNMFNINHCTSAQTCVQSEMHFSNDCNKSHTDKCDTLKICSLFVSPLIQSQQLSDTLI